MKQTKSIMIYVIILLVSGCFILLFSPYTTVLNDYYGIDSAMFDVIGRGLLRGKLLYVDLFDHKGPMIFYIWALGIAIGNGTKWGIFCLQVLSLAVTLLYVYKLSKELDLDDRKTILIFALYLVIFCGVIFEGGLTEEWALPCDVICLYWAIKYLHGKIKYPIYVYSGFLGIFFAYIGWMRINNAVVIAATVFCVAIFLIKDKKFRDLLLCVILFLLGVLVVSLPIVLYFYSKGALGDLLYGSFIYNLKYAKSGFTGKSMWDIVKILSYEGIIILLVLSSLIRKIKNKENVRVWVLSLVSLILAGFSCSLGYTYQHYFMIFLPVLIVAVCLLGTCDNFGNLKKYVIVCMILVLPYSFQIVRNAGKCFLFNVTDYYGDMFQSVGILDKVIPEEERDSVWGIGMTTSKYFAYNDITPCYKMFDAPAILANSTDIYADTVQMLEQARPKWIFRFADDVFYVENMESILNSKYEKVDISSLERIETTSMSGAQKSGILLYRRID